MKTSSIPSTKCTLGGAFSACFIAALLISSALVARAVDQKSPAASPAAGNAQTQSRAAAATQGAEPQPSQADPAAGENQEQERLVSLVLLTKAPRKLSHDAIAHAVSEGIGAKISADAVQSKPPYHLVKVGSDKFIINDIAQPYFEKSAQVADEIKNPNLSRAVRDHRGWVSVDWVSNEQQPDLQKVYEMIGKMVAHLSDKSTLAVYSPDMDQFALWAPTVRQGLEGDDPLAVFEPAEPNQPAQSGQAPQSAAPPATARATP